jgi:hypothetical protein
MTYSSQTLVFPASVREQVLDQHRQLRTLMTVLLDRCTLAPGHDGAFDRPLDDLARDLNRSFGAHLQFEEQALAPVLAVVDHWGPERIRALQEDHARQRREFATVIEALDGSWGTEHLAQTISKLVTDLMRDMDDEEQGCLSPSLLGASFLEIERR